MPETAHHPDAPMNIAITGATGFVGSRLVSRLGEQGHSVTILSCRPDRARKLFPETPIVDYSALLANWLVSKSLTESPNPTTDDYDTESWKRALNGFDAVVNLAGEPIAEKRWSPDQKQLILESRSVTTQCLAAAIAEANPRPSVLVNASAIGFYGTSETATFDETSPSGDDFLAQVCRDWEAAAAEAQVRLVVLRLGIVVGPGGAIAKMVPPFRAFAGGPIGTGSQWFSWVHYDDVVSLIIKAIETPSMSGVYNATAPNPVTMAQVCTALGEVIDRPSWLPVPGFALDLLLGEGAKLVLEGQKVLPKRTIESGFEFAYPEIKGALKQFL
jgi:uncharacterized protein